MKKIKVQIISIAVISILVSLVLTISGSASESTAKIQVSKFFIDKDNGREINPELIQQSINLYQNLSDSQKAAVKDKLAKMAEERKKAIEVVSKQIREYRVQQVKQQNVISQQQRINQLQALEQLALEENATETAKKIANLINRYENNKQNESIEDNSLNVQ
jgi:hypothetical protein